MHDGGVGGGPKTGRGGFSEKVRPYELLPPRAGARIRKAILPANYRTGLGPGQIEMRSFDEQTERRANDASDAKWLSKVALVVSIASLVASIWTALLRHNEWQQASRPQIAVSVTPVFWNVISPDAAAALTPGYIDLYAAQLPTQELAPSGERYGVFVRLVAKHRRTGKIDPNDAALSVISLNQLLAKSGRDPADYLARKHLRFRFVFRNAGATPAKDFSADLQIGSGGKWAPLLKGVPAELAAGQNTTSFAEALFPIESSIPEYIELIATIRYRGLSDEWIYRTERFYFAKRYAAIAVGTPPSTMTE